MIAILAKGHARSCAVIHCCEYNVSYHCIKKIFYPKEICNMMLPSGTTAYIVFHPE